MIRDLGKIAKIINNTLVNAYEEGEIKADDNGDLKPSHIWPWDVSQVVGVHTHLKGVGDGVWFRLNDGTVWNQYGECEVIAKDSGFDTVKN